MISSVLTKALPRQDGSRFNQIFMAVMIIIPTTSMGMILGWISPMQSILQSPVGPLSEPVTEDIISWMAAITFIVSVPCEFLMGFVADRFGRKSGILLTSFALVICWFIKLVCLQPWGLVLARAIGGISCAGCFVMTPLYIKETADADIRGALGSLLILSQNLGYLIIYVIGDLLEYKVVMWICFLIPAVHVVLFLIMPETPSYLIKRGKTEDALSVLAWLRCAKTTDKNIIEELGQLEIEEERSKTGTKASMLSIVTDPRTFKAFRISLTVMLAQEVCGYLVVLMYASQIFEKAASSGQDSGLVQKLQINHTEYHRFQVPNLENTSEIEAIFDGAESAALQSEPFPIGAKMALTANQQAIVLGVVQLVGSIVASSVVEKTGRKLLLAVTSFATGIGMLILGVWFYLTSVGVYLPGWLPISAMCICIFSDAAGFQPTPYVIMSEMFSFKHRGMVTSILVAACSIADFIQTKSFDPLSNMIGIHSTFCIFALLCFLGTIYTILYVPETRNKSLEEIYEELDDRRSTEESKEIYREYKIYNTNI